LERRSAGLLVFRTKEDAHGLLWLKVRLSILPNGSSGWILANFAKLTATGYRIEVSVSHRIVRLLYRGRTVRSYHAVVGSPYWPTRTACSRSARASPSRIRMVSSVPGPST
jgi:hypothetical protein